MLPTVFLHCHHPREYTDFSPLLLMASRLTYFRIWYSNIFASTSSCEGVTQSSPILGFSFGRAISFIPSRHLFTSLLFLLVRPIISVISHIVTDNASTTRAMLTSKKWSLISSHNSLKTGSSVSFLTSTLAEFTCAVVADVTIYGFVMSCFI